MLDLTVTSYGPNALSDLSGLGALNAEAEFLGANNGSASAGTGDRAAGQAAPASSDGEPGS